MTKNRNNWNTLERKELLTLLNEGKSAVQISSKISRSYSAVIAKINQEVKKGVVIKSGAGAGTKYRVIPATEANTIKRKTTPSAVKVSNSTPKSKKVGRVISKSITTKNKPGTPVTSKQAGAKVTIKASGLTLVTIYPDGLLVCNNRLYREA